MICYNCGEKGHLQRLCPKPRATFAIEELHEEGPEEVEQIAYCGACNLMEDDNPDANDWTLVVGKKHKTSSGQAGEI